MPSVSLCTSLQDVVLPKLPVPELEHTIEAYLRTMRPLLDDQQHQKLKQLTEKFAGPSGLGPKLQLYLQDRQEKLDNWVSLLFIPATYSYC